MRFYFISEEMSPPPLDTPHLVVSEQAETTPRNSATPDDDWGVEPPHPKLKSELARGAEREVQLMSSLLVLKSPLAQQMVTAELPNLVLRSRAAIIAAEQVGREEETLTRAEAKMMARSNRMPAAARGLAY